MRWLPEDRLVSLMKENKTDLSDKEFYYVNRSDQYPSLNDYPFQIWYGPKGTGKTTAAKRLVQELSSQGKPVLYFPLGQYLQRISCLKHDMRAYYIHRKTVPKMDAQSSIEYSSANWEPSKYSIQTYLAFIIFCPSVKVLRELCILSLFQVFT